MKKIKNQSGFIALISTIILSTVIVGLIYSTNQYIWFSSINSLSNEYKLQSRLLAEDCIKKALGRLIQFQDYSPPEIFQYQYGYCKIISIELNTPQNNIFTLKTQGVTKNYYTNLVSIINPNEIHLGTTTIDYIPIGNENLSFEILSSVEIPNI